MKVKSKVWLEKNDKLVFGEGKSMLLKNIAKAGSLNRAARTMGISFRHAWGYITAIEKRLGFKLIERTRGGKDGGGCILTSKAKELIQKYDRLKKLTDKFVDKKYRELFGLNK